MDIAEILRRLRLEHNYTQEKLGDVLGVEYSTYGKYEKGASKLRLDQAKILADFYRMSLDDFYNYGEKKDSAQKQSVPILEEDIELYLRKRRRQAVSLTIELDGTSETVNHYLKLIEDLNKLVAARG
ncbi:XRE family transcriptional regulator [Flammeovirgaceae bacterium 311]|nr:XRE family transcriptional regulator [Flammeovirgaceae bacterium 311]